MNDLTHECIEQAFQPATEIVKRLPETTEAKRAVEHLRLAEAYVHEARERARPEGSE